MFKLPLDKDVIIRLLPDTGIKTLYYKNPETFSCFDEADEPVAKQRFNKMRGYFYMFKDKIGGKRCSAGGVLYKCTVNGLHLGMFFGRDGFTLQIGEESFEFETGVDWQKTTDVEVVGSNFSIVEEMMEFVADYYEL